ncbi:MAG: hypothetical protein IKE94_12205 [Aeriscardovia sp.]|nr:hypothetical protein [Aeriscardovia sp.]
MQAETDKQEPQAVRQLIFRSILFCNFFRSVTVYMAETSEKRVRKVRKEKSYFSRGQKSTKNGFAKREGKNRTFPGGKKVRLQFKTSWQTKNIDRIRVPYSSRL